MNVDLSARIDGVNADLSARIDKVNADLSARIDGVNADLSARIDHVIEIVGTHHGQLESRVTRVEDHLGLPHEP
jgi:hypothetical protein